MFSGKVLKIGLQWDSPLEGHEFYQICACLSHIINALWRLPDGRKVFSGKIRHLSA
jgi:hypothetical protein